MTACVVIGLLATPASGAAPSMPAALTTAPEYSNPLSLRIATSGVRDGGVRAARVSPSALSGAVSDGSRKQEALSASGRATPQLPSETCSAHKAVRWYSRRLNDWRGKMGAAVPRSRGSTDGVVGDLSGRCPRYLAHLLQRKSYAARVAFGRWHAYQYDWQAWLPDKWQRIGACETGYGRRPGNWRHSNSSYEGAFGFAVGSWDAFTPYADRKAGPYPRNAYLATPRQQYEVALAIYRRYGLSGWGCRNA